MLCFVVARCGYSGLIKMSVGNANINLTISDVRLCDSLSLSLTLLELGGILTIVLKYRIQSTF